MRVLSSKRIWEGPGGSGRVQEGPGGSRRVRKGLGGLGGSEKV